MNSSHFFNALSMKCPRCHQAKMFYYPILQFKKTFSMKKKCSCCKLNFEPEPGFYYGAMFISYLLTSFFMLGSYFILKLGFHMDTYKAFSIVFVFVVLIYFYIFRVSRSIWLHFFVKYDPEAKCK